MNDECDSIGYKDLKPTFKEAWNYFCNEIYKNKFQCSEINISEYINDKWIEI